MQSSSHHGQVRAWDSCMGTHPTAVSPCRCVLLVHAMHHAHRSPPCACVPHPAQLGPHARPLACCSGVVLHEDVECVVFSEEQLRSRVQEMGRQLAVAYADKEPLVLGVRGGGGVLWWGWRCALLQLCGPAGLQGGGPSVHSWGRVLRMTHAGRDAHPPAPLPAVQVLTGAFVFAAGARAVACCLLSASQVCCGDVLLRCAGEALCPDGPVAVFLLRQVALDPSQGPHHALVLPPSSRPWHIGMLSPHALTFYLPS